MRIPFPVALTAFGLLALGPGCTPADPVAPAACPRPIAFSLVPGGYERACLPMPLARVGQSQQYVIQSQAEYQALVACAGDRPVDFEHYTLLLGKTQTGREHLVLEQGVEQTCAGDYTYAVRLGGGVATAIADVVYHVLVPKLPAGTLVRFAVDAEP